MAGLNLRTLGVQGENLPTKKSLTVSPSDFLIGGMLIDAERLYNKTYIVRSPEEFSEIFGGQITSTDYGPDAVKGFFDNVVGVDAKLVIQTLIGYDTTGDAIDAVVASRNKTDDDADADAYVVSAAYKEEAEYGTSGNRTGSLFTQVDRFATEAAGTVAATSVSTAVLDSVAGIRVGDLIFFSTNAGADPVYKIVIAVDETAVSVSWTGDFETAPAAGETLSLNDPVTIPGFKIQTYRKAVNGIVTEVEVELGKLICSSEALVTEYHVENIHAENKFINIEEASASTLEGRLPTDDASVTYPINGAAGTTVVDVEGQTAFITNFDDDDIRFLANPESTNTAIQKALETYCRGRSDTPLVIYNIPENQTKAQLITIGNIFQRSDDVFGVIGANWLKVTDPFSNSVIAPARTIPNVGHVMGAWIRAIGSLGIHFIPSTNLTPIFGTIGVRGVQLLDDTDRTDVANAGVNMIQARTGIGTKIANLFTPSTTFDTAFANGILMRNFIKVSITDSLSGSENTPNSLNRITSDKMAALQFLYSLWFRGSTGDVAVGETFGQSLDADGNPTIPTDHFQVIADLTNNPQANINLGERNITIYFTYPTPAGSIRIGVGILIRS